MAEHEPLRARDVESVLEAGRSSARARLLHRALLGAVALLAALGGVLLVRGGGGGDEVRYETEAVTRGDLLVTVDATGTVEPTNQVDISSELSGIVREVLVDYNDRVEPGQTLAVLDTAKLAAQVAHSRATLGARQAKVEEAEATVAETRQEYERVSPLVSKSVASKADLDAAKAAYERAVAGLASAKADVAVARATLEVDETNLEKAHITSPIEGVVLQRNVEPGQTVASSFQAPVLFTLADDLAKMQIEVDIDEADIGKTRVGQRAGFTVEAYPGRSFPAEISQLRFAPETVEGVVTYKAVLSIDNSELLLRPGMTATAEITVAQVKDAVLVPNAALRFAPPQPEAKEPGGQGILSRIFPHRPRRRSARRSPKVVNGHRQVWVLRDGEAQEVPVETGETDGVATEVLSGDVAPGDEVVVDVGASG